MIGRPSLLVAAAVVMLATAAPFSAALAQAPSPRLHLLDVPYLPQSEALCGGAAVAMVMRYWGATGIYAETFADLVDARAEGIRGDDLLGALRTRAWDARSIAGDAPLVQTQLSEGRPVIALVEDRPGKFHYVVIVGWAAGRVILHDPARAPFRVLDEREFVERWDRSGRWTLLALPPPGVQPNAPDGVPPVLARPMDPACAGLVDEGVRLAGAGHAADARRAFDAAAVACPSSSAPLRERAGLYALAGEWRAAADDARSAVARDPGDSHAWRILATARYLTDDFDGALDAWNRLGEPQIDLLAVSGVERVRYDVVARAAGVAPGTVLTPDTLRAARRRLGELPAAETARVTYRPQEGGRAVVDAAVIERPLVPRSTAELAVAGVRAISDRELRLDVATPTGGGELWTLSWRWWERRPRVSLAFAAPSPLGGTWRVEVFGERQAYAVSGGDLTESRRGAVMSVSHWTRRGTRWEAALGVDRWDGDTTTGRFGVSLLQRLDGDRLSLLAGVNGLAGGIRATSGSAGVEWRSNVRHEGQVWLARAGVELASAGSPLAWWPGAGTGQGRDVLLRAHPLLDDGRVRGVFGRRLVHGGGEWRAWQRPAAKVLRFGPAVFVDVARAWRGLDAGDARWHTDAGVGLRVAAPGGGVVRIDVARGLRDGVMALSVGWTR